ncbi:GerAB/ArcD/ProY family transporter [Paenibacillus camerounensis]|uniref:GerAB/ArcD/ProY family transporter n=1 Tax=Paenibacillus camerounensis TaxID=1243663 RepID=UPI0005A9D6FE|nr:GerAB/ArcD/ProY family transporter [Paenibacillus camerounensis]
MFRRTEDKINSSQAAVFLIITMINSSILVLPRLVVESTKTPDAWIPVLIAGGVAMLAIWLIVKLGLQFPGKTVFQYGPKIVGSLPAKALCLLLIIHFILVAGLEARFMVEVTLFFLLEGTPAWAVILPFLWVSAYLVSGGINAIARAFQIIFPITITMILLCLLLSYKIFEFTNLRPVLGNGLTPIIHGFPASTLTYSGIKASFILVAFMDKPEQAVKTMLFGVGVVIFIYTITVITVIGGLSISSIVTSPWPTIDLIRSFEISGFFIERLEFPFMVIWLMQMFCTFTGFYYQASLGLSQMFKFKIQVVIFALLPLLYLATITIKTVDQLFMLNNLLHFSSLVLILLIPGLFGLVLLFRRKVLKQNV